MKILSCLLIGLAFSATLPYFYHTTEEVLERIKDLRCSSLKVVEEGEVHVVRIGFEGKCKGFFVFGEHPRELISVELALYLIERLCEEEDGLEVELVIVVNANPVGRRRVENGEFCLRTNGNGVDLNRNWGAFWEKTSCEGNKQVCSGPEAYSEAETKKMKELFEGFSPSLFVSVHSGIDSMMYAYAYTEASIDPNTEKDLKSFLKSVKSEAGLFSEIGQTSVILNYLASGTCLDYAYSKSVPHSFAFEIYQEPSHSTLQVALNSQDSDCFSIFNPKTHKAYLDTLEKWTKALKSSISLACN